MQYFIVGFSITIIAYIIEFSIATKLLVCLHYRARRQGDCLLVNCITHIALQIVFFLCSFFQVNHLHGPFILCNKLQSPKEFDLILWIYKYRFCTEIALFITDTKEVMMQIETNEDLCIYKVLFCKRKILYSSQKHKRTVVLVSLYFCT